MSPQEFVKKWAAIHTNEISVAQTHFRDVCDLVGVARPLDDPETQNDFRFEITTPKPDGSKGRADAFYRGKFVWEYKGAHANLDKALQQVLLYRDALGNPPLLIVSDTQRIIIHTNYTNTIRETHELKLEDLLNPAKLALLKACFAHQSEIDRVFKPTRTQELVTKANADSFVAIADELKRWNTEQSPETIAHFIIRILFSLFAEDMGLLPDHLLRQAVTRVQGKPDELPHILRGLFNAMRDGGWYGYFRIPYFNGDLFDNDDIPTLPGGLDELLLRAAQQDWSEIDPTIFGTLFERIIDPAIRAPLGAHYTSKADILLIVEPVLMQPLRRQWDDIRPKAKRLAKSDPAAAHALLTEFADEIAAVKVLDPACGSGNFLYIALQELLSLQKRVIVFASRNDLPDIPLTVSPRQLYGIEINPYAHELAQITIWIGYLQWRAANGFPEVQEPILQSFDQIERKDAILAYDADGKPVESEWPSADVIIGNPPFLGGKKLRSELGDAYVDDLLTYYTDEVSGESDLVCYWFHKACSKLFDNPRLRVGLIATQAIRSGANRKVLDQIKEQGDIFLAWRDRDWIQDGVNVHVSVIGFDGGNEQRKILDGSSTAKIFADLSDDIDITQAKQLMENARIAFMGVTPVGKFDIPKATAEKWGKVNNATDVDNKDVLKPYFNGNDITKRPRNRWIIDFGESMTQEMAAQYELPYAYLLKNVFPTRSTNNRKAYRERWWIHAEARPGLRAAIRDIERFIGVSMTSTHKFFQWIPEGVLPANLVISIARSDDYFMGVLHSNPHQIWVARNSQLRDKSGKRYIITSAFETFPFPWPPGTEPHEDDNDHVFAIAEAARELVTWRQAWLHPVKNGDGIDPAYKKRLKKRTLTNLYNALQHWRDARDAGELNTALFKSSWTKTVRSDISIPQIEELHDIHRELDHAVLAAYGWSADLTDEQILERLLALNLERAANDN